MSHPLWYTARMMTNDDPYSQMTEQHHADLRAWFDEHQPHPPLEDEGVRCGCEDYPCCGH